MIIDQRSSMMMMTVKDVAASVLVLATESSKSGVAVAAMMIITIKGVAVAAMMIIKIKSNNYHPR